MLATQRLSMSPILPALNALCVSHAENIDAWFRAEHAANAAPIYSSVDIRHAGFKVAPVDTNLFPAGFNNLTQAGMARASEAFATTIHAASLPFKRLLIISENHDRNHPYVDNLRRLMQIGEAAGMEVRVGRFDLSEGDSFLMEGTDGQTVRAESLRREDNQLITAEGFSPAVILLNNDLSAGLPTLLEGIEQPVLPSPALGWYQRRKSVHFEAYQRVANRFADAFGLDSWLISTVTQRCGKINFKEKQGLECVAIGVDKALHTIRQKYAEHGITRTPYVYVKADSGTYGMGVMTAHSGEEIYDINKKTRNKMNVIKEGVSNTEVIIQEGIPTVDMQGEDAAEPVVYLVGGVPVGKVWRINAGRGEEASLNASGMHFAPFDEAASARESGIGLIARLATLAAAEERYDGLFEISDGG
jgi:glutamate--cysteine ligase